MAQTEQTLLIPFKGGLDTWSNPQLLPPGNLTAATGVMLDRPGTAYPGPGYTATQWAPTGTRYNHGIGALSHGPATDADQRVFWSTANGGSGPGISQAGSSASTAVQQKLAPWRQVTQRLQGDTETYLASTFGSMSGPPQCAVSGGRAFYMWNCIGNTGVSMAYQDLSTRAWYGPYYLVSGTAMWAMSGTAESTVTRFAVAGDSTYIRMASLNNVDNKLAIVSWLAADPLAAPTIYQTDNTRVFTQIDACGAGDENGANGVVIALNSTANQVVAFAFSSASASPTTDTPLISNCQAPITCNLVRGNTSSTGFLFGAFITTAPNPHPFVRATDFSLSTTSTGDIAALGAVVNARAMTIGNTAAGVDTGVAIAVEYYPGAQVINGTTFNWNRLISTSFTLNNGTVNTSTAVSTLFGWGGLALMGKYMSWYNGTDFRPLFAARSGWRHTSGTWGTVTTAGATFAYPNGYLYDFGGTIWAKFGDADVGTDALWPAFNAAGYTSTGIQPVPNGFRYNLSSGQQTFSYAWPQLGHADFFSVRDADSGSPIGNRAGLATVTWLAPTASEPAAPMVQFGNSLIVPGTITANYDGSNVFECGYFHRCPTPIVASKGSGGSLPNATSYYVQAVAVYSDAAGRIHYSAPSLRVKVTTTAGSDSIDYRIPAINQTLRTSGTSPIQYRFYRSAGGATGDDIPMYYVSTIAAVNTTGVDFLTTTFNDGTTDANLGQNENIYTQYMAANAAGGTFSPPPFDSIRVWNNQVWGVANRNGPELWCTWPQDTSVLEPEGAAWSVANRLALPAEIGQPRALCDFDEKLIILGSRTDYGIIGSTLDRSTALEDVPNTFSSPVALPTPGGCKVLNGATRLPDGILFQGTQGFSLLGRDLKYAPVGVPVKDFARNNLYLPGVLLPEQPAVLLFSASDVTQNLLWHYDTGEWSQPEQPPIGDGTTSAATGIISAARATAGGSSQMYAIASTQPYYFQIVPFSKYITYRTPWIALEDRSPYRGTTNPTAYGMLQELQVLGILPGAAFGTSQTLTLYTEYDFAGNTNQAAETQILALTSGTQADLEYQWRFGFAQGMAKRVRFTLTVDGGQRTSQGSTQPTVLLTGLMLSYSVDAGLSRLGSANSTGT